MVGQDCLGVFEQRVEWCAGGAVLDGAGDGAQEVAAGAGEVVEGDGDLSAGAGAFGGEGDALGALGDGALWVRQLVTATATGTATAVAGGGGAVLGGGAAGGGQGDLDSSVGGSGLVGGVLDLGLALALAGHAGLPLVQLGELLELGFDGVGAFVGEGLVVGVVLDVVGVAHDGECAAVGVLLELGGDGLELGVGLWRQVGRVRGEGDIRCQGDGDVLVPGVGAGGVVQGPRVALDGRRLSELSGGSRVLVDLLLGGVDVDVGLLGSVGLQDRDGDETGHGDHDGHLVGVDLAEGQARGCLLSRSDFQERAATVCGAPHAPGAQFQELDQVRAGSGTEDGWDSQVLGQTKLIVVVVVGVGVDIVYGGVVLGSGQLQGQDRGGLVLADDGGDPHRDLVAHDVSVELLPVRAGGLGAAAGRGRGT